MNINSVLLAHGIGQTGGSSSSSLKTSLKYTVSTSSPTSPSKGDLWINSNASYTNVSICKTLPTNPSSNTLYILVLGVYGTIDTTKLNTQLGNGFANSAIIDFNVNYPNSNNINFLNTKIISQGKDISWYASPYDVYLGSTKLSASSWNGSNWVKIGYVLYLYEAPSNARPYGFWQYILGDNKITKVKNLPASSSYLDYSFPNGVTSDRAKAVSYSKTDNAVIFSGMRTNNSGGYGSFKWDCNGDGLSTFTSYPLMSRIAIDSGNAHFIYYNNSSQYYFAKKNISSETYIIDIPIYSYKAHADFFNIRVINNKAFIWMAYDDDRDFLFGFVNLDTKAWSNINGNGCVDGIVLDYDETNSTIYGMAKRYSYLDKTAKFYSYNMNTGAYTLLKSIPNVVDYNLSSDTRCGTYQFLGENEKYVYFGYKNNNELGSYFVYDKVAKDIHLSNANDTLNSTTPPSNFIAGVSSISNSVNSNIFTEDENLFTVKNGVISYINYENSNVLGTFNITPFVNDVSLFSPIFVTNGVVR